MTTNESTELELVALPAQDVILSMAKNGLTPSVIHDVTGMPATVIRSVIKRHISVDASTDPELAEAWKKVELEALDIVRRTLRFGAAVDRMSLVKIITGRALARRGAETSEEIEEMRMAWAEIREEQSTLPDRPNRAMWDAEDPDDDN